MNVILVSPDPISEPGRVLLLLVLVHWYPSRLLRIHCGVYVVSAGIRHLSRERIAFCRYPVLNSLLSVCHGLRRRVVPAFGVWFALDLPDGAQSLSSVSSSKH
jgi:hypothetical protein